MWIPPWDVAVEVDILCCNTTSATRFSVAIKHDLSVASESIARNGGFRQFRVSTKLRSAPRLTSSRCIAYDYSGWRTYGITEDSTDSSYIRQGFSQETSAIMNMALCILHGANLLQRLSGETIASSVFLVNLLRHKALKGNTPYYRMFGTVRAFIFRASSSAECLFKSKDM